MGKRTEAPVGHAPHLIWHCIPPATTTPTARFVSPINVWNNTASSSLMQQHDQVSLDYSRAEKEITYTQNEYIIYYICLGKVFFFSLPRKQSPEKEYVKLGSHCP